jgi:hypothetical protein
VLDHTNATPSFGNLLKDIRALWNRAQPGKPTWFKEATQTYTALGGWTNFRSGEWLWTIIEKSFKNYWERANAEYFDSKYHNLGVDQIARKLIAVAAKNASIVGG